MSLSPSNQRLFVAPLASVERQGRRTLGGGGAAVGVSDSLPLRSSTVLGSLPFSFIQPLVHQGQSSGLGSSFSCGEGGGRASPPSLSRLLQPTVCSDEGLRVVEARHRSFHSESSRPQVSIQDGDFPVCASFGAERRLDGISGSQGRILTGSYPSGWAQVSQVRSLRPGIPVQGSVFWSLHCPSGLHEGHGSGVDFSPACGYQDSAVFGQLADPGSFSCSSPSSSGYGAAVVSGLGDCSQLGEIESSSVPARGVSGSDSGFAVFQGFSLPAKGREAFVNRRRIFVLHRAASVILARAFRSSVIPDSSDSRRSPSHAVSSASAPLLVGPSRRLNLSPVGRRLPAGSGVVAGAVSPGVRYLASVGIPRPRLLVRHVRRGLGSSLGGRGRFGPLVSGGGRPLCQRQGAHGVVEGSASVLSAALRIHGGRIRGQLDGSGLSAQARRNSLSRPQRILC